MVTRFPINEPGLVLLAVSAATLAGLVSAGVPAAQWLVAFAIGLTVLTVMLRSVKLSLALLVFAVFINLSDVLIEFHGLPSVGKAYLPFMILLLGLEWLRAKHRPQLPGMGLLVLLVYCVALALSFYYAQDDNRVADGFADTIKNIALGLGLAALVWRPAHLRFALWGIIGGALFLGTLTAVKLASGNVAAEFGGFARSGVKFIAQDENIFRMSGPLQDPNFFGQLMLIAVPIAFERMITEQSRVLKLIAALTLLLSLATIVLTFSRGAFASLVVLTGLALLFSRSRRKWIIAASVAVVISLPLIPSGFIDRFTTSFPVVAHDNADESVKGRTGEMLVAWKMFVDHPVLGVGFQNYPKYFQRYTIEFDQMPRGDARPAHSLYLEVAAERGMVGIFSLAWLLIYLGKISLDGCRTLAGAGRQAEASMIIGLSLGCIGYLLAAVFLHDAYPRYFWLLCGLILAIPGVVKAALADPVRDTYSDSGQPIIDRCNE